jgi:hypothetical protein
VYTLACTGTPPMNLYTVAPCRLVDTRGVGIGPLVAGQTRVFSVTSGGCGVPSTAKAVSLNVAVTQGTAPGNVRLFPAGSPVPLVSTINYGAGRTRANNAIVGLSTLAQLAAVCQPSGSTHLILDVNGYFE